MRLTTAEFIVHYRPIESNRGEELTEGWRNEGKQQRRTVKTEKTLFYTSVLLFSTCGVVA